MVFSDTTNKTGIIQDIEFTLFGDNGYGRLTDSSNINQLQSITRLVNEAQDELTAQIFKYDYKWQYDDKNNTDYPIATSDLIAGQRDYLLSVSHLEIQHVLIKDQSGNWQKLDQFDQTDIGASSYLENNAGNLGNPQGYDIFADSIFLYPVPIYSSAGGIKIYYKRGPSYFLSTDKEKAPGTVSIFHSLIAKKAAYNYALMRNLSVTPNLFNEIVRKENDLKEFYSNRNKDLVVTINKGYGELYN